MVRTSFVIAALPLINALYIPHDFKGLDEIVRGPQELPLDETDLEQIASEEINPNPKPFFNMGQPKPCNKGKGVKAHRSKKQTNALKVHAQEIRERKKKLKSKHESAQMEKGSDLDSDSDAADSDRYIGIGMPKLPSGIPLNPLALDDEFDIEHLLRSANKGHEPHSFDVKPEDIVTYQDIVSFYRENPEAKSRIMEPFNPGSLIEHSYVVAFDENATPEQREYHFAWMKAVSTEHAQHINSDGEHDPLLRKGSIVKTVFEGKDRSARGYAGAFLPSVAEAISRSPVVKSVKCMEEGKNYNSFYPLSYGEEDYSDFEFDEDEDGMDDVATDKYGSHILSGAEPENVIEGRYIVVFDKDASAEQFQSHVEFLNTAFALQKPPQDGVYGSQEMLGAEGMRIHKLYDMGNFRGYAASLLPPMADTISGMPGVAFVERDSKVWALEHDTEKSAPWGLARVSHRKPLSLGNFNKYEYDDEGGEDVTAYIIDTGVYVDHEDFEDRAVWGKTIPIGDTDRDAHGHGSHCAGTIGGKKYGVAKKSKLVGVKVLGSDGSGSMSDVIGGVEYAVQAHKEEQKTNKKHKGSTANMSLGGGKSPSLDLAVNAAVNAGLHFAVAAGNENQDACNVSPAGASGPVTVGATTLRDERAYFSNYGQCVDIFAPGVNILSVGISSPESTAIMSGTSMASPHICGLLTYFLSLQPSSDSEYAVRGAVTPQELKKSLIAFGTPDVLSDLDSASPNVLAYNGGGKNINDLWSYGRDAAPAEDFSDAWLHVYGAELESLGEESRLAHFGHVFMEELGEAAVKASVVLGEMRDLVAEAF